MTVRPAHFCFCLLLQAVLSPCLFSQAALPSVGSSGDYHSVSGQRSGVYLEVITGWSEIDSFVVQVPPSTTTAPSQSNSSSRLAGGGGSGGSVVVATPNPPAIGRFNEGFMLGTAMGFQLNQQTRIEAEGTWRSNSGRQPASDAGSSVDTLPMSGHLNNYAGMVNLLHDVAPVGAVNFYGGVGLGMSRIDGQFDSSVGEILVDDWLFAYQGIAGLEMRPNDFLSMSLEYRYFGNTGTEIEIPAATNSSFDYIAENIVFRFSISR